MTQASSRFAGEDDPGHWRDVELGLTAVVAAGEGIAGLVRATARLTPNPIWLVDVQDRVVARSTRARGSDFEAPQVGELLARHGLTDASDDRPLIVAPAPAHGFSRRHALQPVRRGNRLFGWLVMAEVIGRIGGKDLSLLSRSAFHLASEYTVQRRVARASWNAKATLARQLVRGHTREDDITDAADYLGIQINADRVLVYISDTADRQPRDEERLCSWVAEELDVEVFGSRGREGTILLVEAPASRAPVIFVQEVKSAIRRLMKRLGEETTSVGISRVTGVSALPRSFRETSEAVLCVDRFGKSPERVIAVDDLGPARLFVANGDLDAVRRYVQDVVGPLLDGGPAGHELLRTLQGFFDAGRNFSGVGKTIGCAPEHRPPASGQGIGSDRVRCGRRCQRSTLHAHRSAGSPTGRSSNNPTVRRTSRRRHRAPQRPTGTTGSVIEGPNRAPEPVGKSSKPQRSPPLRDSSDQP